MTFPFVVGVTGYAQHGKDTIAARLVDRWGFKRFAFADPLKSLAVTLDPMVGRRRSGAGSRYIRLSELVAAKTWEGAKQVPEVRRFLQVLGTEGVRNHLGDDAWVKACGKAFLADSADKVVIPDVRFPNEAEYIQETCGGVLIKVVRLNEDGSPFDNGIGTEHPSERHVAGLRGDYEVGAVDVAALLASADAIAAELEEGFRPARAAVYDYGSTARKLADDFDASMAAVRRTVEHGRTLDTFHDDGLAGFPQDCE